MKYALESPVKPPPITATSTSKSRVREGLGGAWRSAQYDSLGSKGTGLFQIFGET